MVVSAVLSSAGAFKCLRNWWQEKCVRFNILKPVAVIRCAVVDCYRVVHLAG